MQDLGKLSQAELSIMEKIWEFDSPITVSDMLEAFANDKTWKTQTMSTFLTRLMDKGFLSKTTVGKTNIFEPKLTRTDYIAFETSGFLSTVHGGSLKSFMTALVDNTSFTSAELDELKEWLDKGEYK